MYSGLVNFIQIQYAIGKVTITDLKDMLEKKILNEEEYDFIISNTNS